MVFHSAEFAILLAITLFVWWFFRDRRTIRTLFTLAASLVFYGWGLRAGLPAPQRGYFIRGLKGDRTCFAFRSY